jgi:hypothetical protein
MGVSLAATAHQIAVGRRTDTHTGRSSEKLFQLRTAEFRGC